MAFAIMGGLLVATMLTLVLLPVLYMIAYGREDRGQKVKAAEPAMSES
jgi:Cu/Ag efflux pump CusA